MSRRRAGWALALALLLAGLPGCKRGSDRQGATGSACPEFVLAPGCKARCETHTPDPAGGERVCVRSFVVETTIRNQITQRDYVNMDVRTLPEPECFRMSGGRMVDAARYQQVVRHCAAAPAGPASAPAMR